jgi:NADPH:quinone reductase-like Zn-dependent oxidoreductase
MSQSSALTRSHCLVHPREISLTTSNRYVYILGPTEQYLLAVGTICTPFGKVCSIVQADIRFYGTEFMSKSLTFSWDWLGSGFYHRTNLGSYRTMITTLASLMEEGKLVPTLGKRYKLTLAGLKEAHRQIESKTTVGKIGLGVDEPGEGVAFA